MNSETETERKPKLEDSFGGTVEKNIPDDVEWIDDAFYIKKTRFGLYTSILKNPIGQHFITGPTKEAVLTICLLYTSPSPRDQRGSRMPSSA